MEPAQRGPLHMAAPKCPLASLPSGPCSAPSVTATADGPTSGSALIVPPVNNRPWSTLDLRVCVKGTSDCRSITGCAANATDASGTTRCPIPGCAANTTYTVWATAQQPGLTSPESQGADFTTPPFP